MLHLISNLRLDFVPPFLGGCTKSESRWFSLLIYAEAVVLFTLAAYRTANEVRGYAIASITRALVFMLVLVIMFSSGYFLIDSIHDVLKWRLAASVAGVILSFVFIKCIDNLFFLVVNLRKSQLENGTEMLSDMASQFWLRYCWHR
jgi:hypothetical protein